VICKVIFFPNFQRKNDAEKEYQRVKKSVSTQNKKSELTDGFPFSRSVIFPKRSPGLLLFIMEGIAL
jgi:hypothetical protein